MHQRPNSLSMMWERSLMTDLLMSMAVFLRELYVLYIALVFHSRVSKLSSKNTYNIPLHGTKPVREPVPRGHSAIMSSIQGR